MSLYLVSCLSLFLIPGTLHVLKTDVVWRGPPLMGGFDFRRCLVAVVLVSWSYGRVASRPWFIYFLLSYGPNTTAAMGTLSNEHL